ncbi:hypothetical protein [Hymenobacter volaticus]|uniref:Secreted protein n=1 Tax=Hymenobacter volaticus TaxID=2932254 RepID=A0ABY4G227_9BACT|nr:hypothetical protein [Hymenobacter volaticus]UOQ64878.1 hypothetical protein MUN86_15045 [Hymenobacter volaticus]
MAKPHIDMTAQIVLPIISLFFASTGQINDYAPNVNHHSTSEERVVQNMTFKVTAGSAAQIIIKSTSNIIKKLKIYKVIGSEKNEVYSYSSDDNPYATWNHLINRKDDVNYLVEVRLKKGKGDFDIIDMNKVWSNATFQIFSGGNKSVTTNDDGDIMIIVHNSEIVKAPKKD